MDLYQPDITENENNIFFRVYNTREALEEARLRKAVSMSDQEKFEMLCRMMRIQLMFASARNMHKNSRGNYTLAKDEALLNFWQILDICKVQYILIGDFAMALHGFKYPQPLLQILVKDDFSNRRKLSVAFEALGFKESAFLGIARFTHNHFRFIVADGMELEINTEFQNVEGLSFNECQKCALTAQFEELIVPYLSIDHLITYKKVLNRPKDQLDTIELERIKEIKGQ